MKNKIIFIILTFFIIHSCGLYRPVDVRKTAGTAKERARQNIEEGRGVSLQGLVKGRNQGYEFSSSNPLWRASLETLDFLPLSTVDYSGGIIITDWYMNSADKNESLKITIRFLNNEIRSDSLKITVHQKKCLTDSNCLVNKIESKIQTELTKTILSKAANLEKEKKIN